MGLFDQIGKTLNQGIDRAKFEAEKFQKTTRLQGEINEVRRQLDAKLMEMGQRAYDLQRAGQISAPSIAEMAGLVDQLRSTLVTHEEELKIAQNEVFEETPLGVSPTSPSQSVPISYDAPPMVTPPMVTPPMVTPPPASAQKICPSCGFQMPSSAMFCPNCGARVG
ncbi:zinc ribbon domain-containing protein [Candidatus Oscillochloris fontis]|uniref:zinc ribbon domain-containing protein n=1 Tax=Candidatus Oscillochloris fontis TaxID=2496868 RepID=UPI00101DFE99|nr:zinc ribbon domain-containing protein [Candidatus Oscillochloris fontis]